MVGFSSAIWPLRTTTNQPRRRILTIGQPREVILATAKPSNARMAILRPCVVTLRRIEPSHRRSTPKRHPVARLYAGSTIGTARAPPPLFRSSCLGIAAPTAQSHRTGPPRSDRPPMFCSGMPVGKEGLGLGSRTSLAQVAKYGLGSHRLPLLPCQGIHRRPRGVHAGGCRGSR